MLPAIRTLLASLAALAALATNAAADTVAANDTRRDVDFVIALDISGSMEGLIESAKHGFSILGGRSGLYRLTSASTPKR